MIFVPSLWYVIWILPLQQIWFEFSHILSAQEAHVATGYHISKHHPIKVKFCFFLRVPVLGLSLC